MTTDEQAMQIIRDTEKSMEDATSAMAQATARVTEQRRQIDRLKSGIRDALERIDETPENYITDELMSARNILARTLATYDFLP